MAEDVRSRYARILGRGEGTERIQFFSDAVFAIAMTLLVLEIRVPGSGELDWAELGSLWPSYLAYVLSFVIIGLNWITHHRKFRFIDRFDGGLVWINLLFLLVIAFVPFPTSLMAEHGDETPAIVLYAVTVASLSLLQLWLWVHAHRNGLMDAQIDPELYRYVRTNLLPVPIVFLATIPIAFLWPSVATLFWVLIAPVSTIMSRRMRAKRDPAIPTPARRSRG